MVESVDDEKVKILFLYIEREEFVIWFVNVLELFRGVR